MMRLVAFSAVVAVAFGAVAFNGDPKTAQILRSTSNIAPDGAFDYGYETENGIVAQEQGVLKQVGTESALVVQGDFNWLSPEGEPISIQYVADENGYQPTGNAIPTPPPIPADIAKALEFIRAHPPAAETSGLVRGGF